MLQFFLEYRMTVTFNVTQIQLKPYCSYSGSKWHLQVAPTSATDMHTEQPTKSQGLAGLLGGHAATLQGVLGMLDCCQTDM
jgi:hypothetical protein